MEPDKTSYVSTGSDWRRQLQDPQYWARRDPQEHHCTHKAKAKAHKNLRTQQVRMVQAVPNAAELYKVVHEEEDDHMLCFPLATYFLGRSHQFHVLRKSSKHTHLQTHLGRPRLGRPSLPPVQSFIALITSDGVKMAQILKQLLPKDSPRSLQVPSTGPKGC